MQLEEFKLWILFSIIIGFSLSVDLGVISKIKFKLKNRFGSAKTVSIYEGLSFKQSLIRVIV